MLRRKVVVDREDRCIQCASPVAEVDFMRCRGLRYEAAAVEVDDEEGRQGAGCRLAFPGDRRHVQRRHAAALALLRQYLHFCTSKPATACGCACPRASAFVRLY